MNNMDKLGTETMLTDYYLGPQEEKGMILIVSKYINTSPKSFTFYSLIYKSIIFKVLVIETCCTYYMLDFCLIEKATYL